MNQPAKKPGPRSFSVEIDASLYGAHCTIPVVVEHNSEEFICGGTSAEGVPCIRSKKTGKTVVFTWQDLIDAAVRTGIDEEGR